MSSSNPILVRGAVSDHVENVAFKSAGTITLYGVEVTDTRDSLNPVTGDYEFKGVIAEEHASELQKISKLRIYRKPEIGLESVVMTQGIKALFEQGYKDDLLRFLCYHKEGTWGELSKSDLKANDASTLDGEPLNLLSSYFLNDIKIWIKTEGEHTIVLLPSEY